MLGFPSLYVNILEKVTVNATDEITGSKPQSLRHNTTGMIY